MIYLFQPNTGRREIAETEAARERLEARGYVRCSPGVHLRLWRIADRAAGKRIALDDGREAERERAERIVGKLPGKVYPKYVPE